MLESPAGLGPKGTADDDMLGEVEVYTAQADDTLVDLARDRGLGYVELVAANPRIDPWLPRRRRDRSSPWPHSSFRTSDGHRRQPRGSAPLLLPCGGSTAKLRYRYWTTELRDAIGRDRGRWQAANRRRPRRRRRGPRIPLSLQSCRRARRTHSGTARYTLGGQAI